MNAVALASAIFRSAARTEPVPHVVPVGPCRICGDQLFLDGPIERTEDGWMHIGCARVGASANFSVPQHAERRR